jgi:hypothetical protein
MRLFINNFQKTPVFLVEKGRLLSFKVNNYNPASSIRTYACYSVKFNAMTYNKVDEIFRMRLIAITA